MKILIISHMPISNLTNAGKALLSLFTSFDKEELCNIYIYPSIPNLDVCSSFYRITDKEILKSYFSVKKVGSSITYNVNSNLYENIKDKKIYDNPKNKDPLRCLLRDSMWKYSRWYNKKIIKWISEQKPTHIFLLPGKQKFIYNIALKISQSFNLPIIDYICDDYYFLNYSKKCFYKTYLNTLRKTIDRTLTHSKILIGISDGIKNMYSEYFHIQSDKIMIGTNYDISTEINNYKNISKINYFGNIGCKRYKSLLEIGITLEQINKKFNNNYQLHIYTRESNYGILSNLKDCSAIYLHDFVSGEKFKSIFFNSEALLHTESFDEDSIDLVKNSISTKIADSLASGIPIFAYGSSQIASMQHLLINECAYICCEHERLESSLIDFFSNYQAREIVAAKGLLTAKAYHDSFRNSEKLYDIFSKICND